MATYESIHKAIELRVESAWANFGTIFAENVKEVRPTTVTWARFSVRMADSHDADVTGLHERAVGQIMFQVFTPEAKGSRVAHQWRDKVAAMFNAKRLPTEDGGVIRCRRAYMVYAGKDEGIMQNNVIVPFWHDAPALNAA